MMINDFSRIPPRAPILGWLALLLAAGLVGGPAVAQIPACETLVTTEIQADIKKAMGFPVLHDDEADSTKRGTVCHDQFCTEFDGERKTPVWVAERLTTDIVTGDNPRPRPGWKHDPKLLGDDDIPEVRDREYKHSGLARGHMAASADFKCSVTWMKQTFIFSNAVPQVQHGFNGGAWRWLEDHIQKLAKERSEVITITGPVHLRDDGAEIVVAEGQNACGRELTLAGLTTLGKAAICNENDTDSSQACKAGVAVPSGLFKIIYVPESKRVFAFLMSNEDHRPFRKSGQSTGDYLEEWRVSINVIEGLTNLQFFPDWSSRAEHVAINNCTETRWR